MPQYVYQFPSKTIAQMKDYYANSSVTPPPGAIFRAKTSEAVITAYKSGKVLFQGSSPEKAASIWQQDASTIPANAAKSRKHKSHAYAPDPKLFSSNHAGTDEAGTGDYFGPITVAAVYLTKTQIDLLKSHGVTDSKALTDTKIRQLAQEITNLNIPYSLIVLRNEKYNKLQSQGWTQGKMKTMLHHHAIQRLLKKVDQRFMDGIIIDQFCEPSVYKKHLASEKQTLTSSTFFITKAESYSTSVAAASILARTSFLKQMDQLSEQTGIILPKGASQKVDQTAATIMKKYGTDVLSKIAKIHFANTTKAQVYLK
ncbi:ribonuclease HIII [Virgibacillus pantothenticus]|uniref:ribonuclease HIII n=1 Tax=Virgibacillus TaxID=84406 RepID=UPI000934A899|nr:MULTISPECIES: ribonuclease HIII [Virgibacillus]MBS7426781.1 ribonuclease HIII [Virgibacillus sp. 19R1-5]MBU8566108.1 ribonuclease HIII [Virgibacillus pantothenticus]MBU8600596.1 ribonuclease HIII [Virgibacillus pantothenticus]MBU8634428.1 ribonuclease HIII [Virgibacillus pantothenticus]MBU8642735.1 ribonuclease HIII [Virgibacillus pantothenticus]